LEDAWNGSIENSGVRGKYKRALKIWAEHDVEMTVEGLRHASPACVKVWQEWSGTWADAETARVIKHLDTLDHMRKQEEWVKRQKDARKHRRQRSRDLAQRIVEHVQWAGGAIEFIPAVVAAALHDPKGMQARTVWKVSNIMRALTKNGTAKIVAQGKGKADRFVLRICDALGAPTA